MAENKKEAAKAADQVFVVKSHKITKLFSIVGFKSLEHAQDLKKQQSARYDFFKVPVEKL